MTFRKLLYWAVAAFVVYLFWSVSAGIQRDERPITYSELLRYLEAGAISEVTVTGSDRGSQITGTFNDGQHFRTFAPPQAYDLVDRMISMGVEVRSRDVESTSWREHLISWTPIVIMVAFLIFFLRAGAQSQAFDAHQWRLGAKARALERLSSSDRDLSDEEIMACLLEGAKRNDGHVEARKALYEMLAEKTVVVTAEKKYRLATAP